MQIYALVPFLTSLGTLKGLEKHVFARTGPFAHSDNGKAEVDQVSKER